MNLRTEIKKSVGLILVFFVFLGCNEQAGKKYEDYNEEDFVEVQGLVINVQKEFAYQSRKVDLTYIYDLDNKNPSIGFETDSPFIPMEGAPAIILVHKFEDKVTFFGRTGYVENEGGLVKRYLEKSEKSGVQFYGVDESLLNQGN